MQVYREIPEISNQKRGRPAEMTGIVPVREEWNVARHSRAARERIENVLQEGGVPVLDAGTGMYLNATVLDTPLAPAVPVEVREKATRMAEEESAANPHRRIRKLELALTGEDQERGSVWEGSPDHDLALIYLRPTREEILRNIRARTARIVKNGLPEAQRLIETEQAINPSVLRAVGISEMMELARGNSSEEEARERIEIRTRKLARRQRQWFDKLVSVLASNSHRYEREVSIQVVETSKTGHGGSQKDVQKERAIRNCIHDIIGT